MRAGGWVLAVGGLLGAAILVGYEAAPVATPASGPARSPASVRTALPAPEPIAPAPARAAVPEWAGSEICAECHPDITERWRATGHGQATHPFPSHVAKAFDGEVFVARGEEHRLGPGGWMECEGPGGKNRRFPVEWVIGTRRVQMFLTRLDRGRIQVLPVFIEVPKRRWFDYSDFIFGFPRGGTIPPDSAYSWYGPHRNWNSRCGRCHMTEFSTNYDPDSGTFDSTWVEPFVGCEGCHGPSGGHVEKWRHLDDREDPTVNPIKLTVERANQVCGYCHTESMAVDAGYRPGDDLFAHLEVAGLEDKKHAFPDGRARELIHNLLPIMESRCGQLACTRCHDPHGRGIAGDLYWPLDDDRICTQCHDDIAVELAAHTHHEPESRGSRCIACHMPRLVIEGGHGRVYDHTISIPSIRNTQRFGLPNACRTCHDDRSPGWEYESFEQWYPGADKRNHRVGLAETLDAARAGRVAQAREGLLRLARDRSPVYRAAAARYLATDPEADLRPMLADAHSYVRRAAVDGVARRDPEALVPLLDERKNPVLRRAAALALATHRMREPYDWIAGRPALRDRVLGILEEFARITPDRDGLHFVLSRLHRLAGHAAEADAALERYYRLRPWERPRR